MDDIDIEVTPTTPGVSIAARNGPTTDNVACSQDVTIPSTPFSIICQQSSMTTQHTPPNNASSGDDFVVLIERVEQLLSRSRTPVILVISPNINDFLNIQLRLVNTFSEQISVLPAFTPDDAVTAIKVLVTGYHSGLQNNRSPHAPNPLGLISQMTTHPPLVESATYMLHDMFPSIADIANATVQDMEVLGKRDAHVVVGFWEEDWVFG
ncbi:hypothetical protein SAICODRAFT_29099 [Saitoella complicata NRRL Y-17804]|uniref:uncharacterized protein n=1 Tax=Saitoella complicata (strain BCRC 22490 / CBS 7301 / JCM 7358 / NBRC 10748 / NRRL Y-17804) TaxID=698492 RepID=UPI0008676029|nr:uncharacterized protein SAICODRAFT_29099 [Saitoella complicata NRRL Y-17804]ODQ55546.1 hypothetical protein SAICODRAFT_29099 [Saitoella complicata NRRL Y-17804]